MLRINSTRAAGHSAREVWLSIGKIPTLLPVSFREGDCQSANDQSSTLDIFYLAQIAAGTYRSSDQLESDIWPSSDDFDTFYTQHHPLLNPDAWKQYYSPAFLSLPTTARFYRLPNLRDLPDSSDPLGEPRPHKGSGHHPTRLPRWAHHVTRTRRRQPTLALETIRQLALSTLAQTISRLEGDSSRGHHPSPDPYSETQARFWLKYMGIDKPHYLAHTKEAWNPNQFGLHIAQGGFDLSDWEAHYSLEVWESDEARIAAREPDLDGTRKSEVWWCGMPDGGIGLYARLRGWEPELGSEEEVAFLAAVAVKEAEAVIGGGDGDGDGDGDLDYAMRSHMFVGVMRAVFETAERERWTEELKRGIVEAGRIDEEKKAEEWLQQVLMVMEPYVQKVDGQWPAAVEDRSELLRQILMENGQVFARWKLSPLSKEFSFELKPRI